jgi:outer membrane protein assembly factor BamD (BamD/ComL family)
MMKRVILSVFLILMPSRLLSNECSQMQSTYAAAEKAYEASIRNLQDARIRYPLINTVMDNAVMLLAYCHETASLSEQHILRNRLRKLDKQRSDLATAAVDEYRRQYGIKPEIQTIYRDRIYSNTPSHSPFPPPLKKPLPQVIQPAMPPVSR